MPDTQTPAGLTTTVALPRTVLIANRGEIAVRIAATCRAMGIATVAVHSDPDADAAHVHACDAAVRLPGATPTDTYLRGDLLLDAAARTGADAVHPGFGFLAEDATFAHAVVEAGLTWIGPMPDTIAAMGDKLEAKQRMAEAGVPVVPGATLPADHDDQQLLNVADELGLPLLVKAAAGGGGKGMRAVHDRAEVVDAVAAARREAASAFGDGRVFLERLIERPRHVEVQVLGDRAGHVVHLHERECSIQRRHQKILEEAPSPGIDDRVRAAITDAALTAAEAIGYQSAGTVEFVVDDAALARRRAGDDVDPAACFAFLEVNTRLQVEHPVTEATVAIRHATTCEPGDLDLVRWQLLIVAGQPLSFTQDQVVARGHAIEVRLYAEDPANDDLPAIGHLAAFAPAHGAGIRWDAGVRAGDDVTPYYDPMLAKVIAVAPTRAEAAARLAAELDATHLLGVTTNRDLLAALLRDEPFLAGDTTTDYLDRRRDALLAATRPAPEVVDLAVALATVHAVEDVRRDAPVLATLPAGFANAATFPVQHTFRTDDADGETLTVRLRVRRDGTRTVSVLPGVPAGHLDDDVAPRARFDVVLHDATDDRLDVEVDGVRRGVTVLRGADGATQVAFGRHRVALTAVPRFAGATAPLPQGATLAPMPGTVVDVPVDVGDAVTAGQRLVTVEAMKMEHRITARVDGTVAEVAVAAGQQVDADAVLVVVDPTDAPDVGQGAGGATATATDGSAATDGSPRSDGTDGADTAG